MLLNTFNIFIGMYLISEKNDLLRNYRYDYNVYDLRSV